MKKTLTLASAACLVSLATLAGAPAYAATAIYWSGPLSVPIPDDDANGISSTITATPGANFGDSVPVGGAQVVGVELGISIDHTFVGDLTMTLMGPDGTTVTLVDRPGEPDQGAFGDSANASSSFPLLFSDRSQWDAENMGLDCPDSDDVIGADCRRAFRPDDPLELFAVADTDLLGDWTLTISDNAAADTGTLTRWYIELEFVPVPAAAWLFGSALLGLVGVARRRS